jgi:hypothetical protein
MAIFFPEFLPFAIGIFGASGMMGPISGRGYEGPMRQLAVDGPGREKPTLFLSNDLEETARNIVIRYAGRKRVEDGVGISEQ